MPNQRCSVCIHPQLAAIEAGLKSGLSVRESARRFGLSPAAIDRHVHHDARAKSRVNIEQIAHIDEQIKKLTRAQNAAKKRRDNASALAIARELRSWFVLKGKAQAVVNAAQTQQPEPITRAEAIGVAKAIIESEVNAGAAETIEWLRGLTDRVQRKSEVESVAAAPERVESEVNDWPRTKGSPLTH
jgi:predicted transcriptional regulator